MHPAFSVILLTTLIGAGQGLFLALYTDQVYSVFRVIRALPPTASGLYAMGSLIALVLLAAGLLASFFHLGRPERAWRAASQWRTSWLSREVLLLPAFMALVAAYGGLHHLGWDPLLARLGDSIPVHLSLLVGAAGTLAAFALFICTGMIYASLRFLQEWASPLTVLNFILLGTASGFTLAAGLAAWRWPALTGFYGLWAIALTLAAAVLRTASLVRNHRLRHRSSPQTAIGIRHPQIVQKAQGAMGGAFNTREFFHGRSDAWVRLVRHLFLLLGFVLPVAVMAAGLLLPAPRLLVLAFALQYLGLVAERWYFFAEARHPQNLYYQAA